MARNAIESDFRPSKMPAGGHFVDKKKEQKVKMFRSCNNKCSLNRAYVLKGIVHGPDGLRAPPLPLFYFVRWTYLNIFIFKMAAIEISEITFSSITQFLR